MRGIQRALEREASVERLHRPARLLFLRSMKLLRTLLILGSVFVATGLLSAKEFEGVIKMEIRDGKNAMPMEYSVKKNKVRMDLAAEGMTMTSLLDLDKKEMITLMPQQNMYMVFPFQEALEEATKGRKGPEVTKTGETEEILGYLCTKYVTTEGRNTTEIWAAEGIGMFMGMGTGKAGPMGKQAPRTPWEEEMIRNGFFPMRVVTKNRSGKETSRMEVVALDRRTLPDSHFAIPEGFQRFDMGGMMKGLMKGLVPGAK
jgi:hypothetical protein